MAGRDVVVGVIAAHISLGAAVAHAHPVVDAGWERANDGNFVAALREFEEAERRNDLEEADLVELLEGRAYVHYARAEQAELGRAIRQLATVAPDHALTDLLPPEVHELFEAAVADGPGAIVLRVDHQVAAAQRSVIIATADDAAGLVREVRVHARSDGRPWQVGVGSVRITVGDRIDVYAEAIGPGGVVLAALGSADAPVDERGRPRETTVIDGRVAPDQEEPAVPTWMLTAGGAAVAILVVTLIAIVASGTDDDTRLHPAIQWQ